MLAIIKAYQIWIQSMSLVVLIFIGYKLHNIPNNDYTEKLSNIEKVLNDMNTLDYYNKGKKLK